MRLSQLSAGGAVRAGARPGQGAGERDCVRYHYNPDAYSHGGSSLGELMIPMIVLRVKERADSLLALGPIAGLEETIEGEAAAFTVTVRRGRTGSEELRVEIEASYAADPERFPLPGQVIYPPSPPAAAEVVYRCRPDPEDATADERRAGAMRRTLTITATTRDGRRTIRKSQSVEFQVRLNTERVIRRVGNLGAILGLMPKGGGS